MNVEAYLERINYKGSLTPSLQCLRELHLAQLLSVPFENLSIHNGQPIVLDESDLFEKIVRRRRGGFCYELNGMFAALLRELGFNVTMLSASMVTPAGDFGPEFDHMALLVTLEQRWLADVGSGESFREPLLIDNTGDQAQFGRVYRIVTDGAYSVVMQLNDAGEWKPRYRFSLQPHQFSDFAGMCHYHQTSPLSHFTRQRICSLAKPDGRITLSDNLLIETDSSGKRNERLLLNDEECASVLLEQFGIIV